jgi:hypothetical protein
MLVLFDYWLWIDNDKSIWNSKKLLSKREKIQTSYLLFKKFDEC